VTTESQSSVYWDGVVEGPVTSGDGLLWRVHSDMLNAELLRRWLPASARRALKTDLFDEALTQGLYPLIAERAGSVAGIDLSQATVALARARHPDLEAAQADVRKLPFGDGEFDLVFSNSTLDHFERREDIRAGLRELHRVLEPGGELLITLDNRLNPLIAMRNALPFPLLKGVGLVPYYVGPTLGPRGLRCALEETGFDVVERRAIMHCPRAVAIAIGRRLDRRGSARARRAFLRSLLAWERLGRLPTAPLTGHFVAARAVRR
jgi:SAM-dependent methyltransferase